MTAPEKLWLLWREGGHVKCRVVASEMDHSDEGFPEYIRADLLDARIGAVLDDWKSRIENLWITADNDREEWYDEGLGAALEELSFVRPDALQALERVRREARVEFASEIVSMLTAMRGPVDVPRTERAVWVDEGIDRCIGEINALIEAERGQP